ncbi:amino acid ABC transporter ATP-binding protein [Oryzomonas japonica]|uniref:Amino acid ABC transporter ATP-binding protein n=1 Tax=Oryzomonas japonica TaxID=2603858 RepID=A0A7J4ZS58_9BACT|nr:amino acid ABC transporter ATP-binding protein [Oryzomonas japonica]KAB0666097.1 amino acid ABC transporter ATP-binding protein [Oryzomonas japonica]
MRLEVSAIVKSYGDHVALNGVTLAIPEVRTLAILGPSGGGKSTLLRILAGLETPDGGEIALDGDPIQFNEAYLLRHRRGIGTVFQSFNLFPHLTALDNIALPLEKVHGYEAAEAATYALQLLARFHLAGHALKTPAQLSGGQKQRVAIARAVAIKPRLLLFDEPTSALDPEMTVEVLDLIAELRQEGRPLVLVTHEIGFARQVADQVVFLHEGRVLEWGDAAELFEQPTTPEMRGFLDKVLRY